MKRKFIILTLCFTIIFSSINFKKVEAMDFVITPVMLATVSTLAVGTGIALKNIDDIYDIGRLFFDYVNNSNSIMWDTVVSVFQSSVSFNEVTKKVTVGKEFCSILKGFFDKTFGVVDDKNISGVFDVGIVNGYPDLSFINDKYLDDVSFDELLSLPGVNLSDLSVGSKLYYSDLYYVKKISDSSFTVHNAFNDVQIWNFSGPSIWKYLFFTIYLYDGEYRALHVYDAGSSNVINKTTSSMSSYLSNLALGTTAVIPYTVGSYNPSNVWDNSTSLNDVSVYVPGDLSDILNVNPSDVVGDKAPSWVGNGSVSVPNVESPSISVGGVSSFPNVGVENPPVDIPDVENPPVDTPDVENPPIGGIIPPFPSFGDSLDFSPMYLTNINEKFPFSLPWDIGRLIQKFDIDPKAPIFKVPIVTSEIELDLTIFDEWANIGRFFVLIGFVLSLILISTKLLG